MKSLKLILLLATTLILSTSCRKNNFWGIRGSGSNITETRNINGYNGIQLSIDADINYTQDSVYSIEINGQKNILSVLETNIEGNVMVIKFNRNVWKHNKVTINIHSPQMEKLSISGSGNINVQNNLTGNNLSLGISGSGNISVPSVSVQSLSSNISGSGNVNVNGGSAKTGSYTISGSGSINTESMPSLNSSAKISGSGDIILNATEALDATISGSGNVKYRGKAKINVQISGSGKLIHLD